MQVKVTMGTVGIDGMDNSYAIHVINITITLIRISGELCNFIITFSCSRLAERHLIPIFFKSIYRIEERSEAS